MGGSCRRTCDRAAGASFDAHPEAVVIWVSFTSAMFTPPLVPILSSRGHSSNPQSQHPIGDIPILKGVLELQQVCPHSILSPKIEETAPINIFYG
ncbi:MAG: hypothetical protein M1130_11465 [Actinobacteria bacterium]|nr:hypothetical protein [Actinomycetota bacterium]